MTEIILAIITVLIIIISGYFIIKLLNGKDKLKQEIVDIQLNYQKQLEFARKESVKKSKDVTRGHISEEFIPLFPDFPYDMSDCKFSGKPVDYLIFHGMSAIRDGEDAEIEIIFADVKTNTSQRSKIQNAIKKAIQENRVRWETWNINENKQIIIK